MVSCAKTGGPILTIYQPTSDDVLLHTEMHFNKIRYDDAF